MSDMEMKVLAEVVANADLPSNEIMSAVCAAFPNEPYALIKGYIYQFKKAGWLGVVDGDNRIVKIRVNPSAYVALRESKNVEEEKSSVQVNVGSITGVSGQLAIANKGGSYNMTVSKIVVHEMTSGLKEVLKSADRKITDELEREQIKRLIQRIVESLEKSEPPPQGFIEKLDSFMQKHSWIAAPLASAFLNALAKFFH